MSNINNEQLKQWAKQIYDIACAPFAGTGRRWCPGR